MAKHELHDRALDMRKNGASYTQIKAKLGVSKSTLSGWLQNHPLSPERLKELRTNNERQIERIRETKARKKDARIQMVYKNVKERIGFLTNRELFISGLFLYWAEGTKASPSVVCMTNTDPSMLQFFIHWLEMQGVDRSRLTVRLHLYADMDIDKETEFWIRALELPNSAFRTPYIKKSFENKRKNYKGRFGHGTCNITFNNRDMYELIMRGIKHLGKNYRPVDFVAAQRV